MKRKYWRHNNQTIAITWIVISNSLDIDFIHGDIHGRSCKKIRIWCSTREPFRVLLPLLCHVVPLHNGNCRLTIPLVKECCARDALAQTLNIGVFKSVEKFYLYKTYLKIIFTTVLFLEWVSRPSPYPDRWSLHWDGHWILETLEQAWGSISDSKSHPRASACAEITYMHIMTNV